MKWRRLLLKLTIALLLLSGGGIVLYLLTIDKVLSHPDLFFPSVIMIKDNANKIKFSGPTPQLKLDDLVIGNRGVPRLIAKGNGRYYLKNAEAELFIDKPSLSSDMNLRWGPLDAGYCGTAVLSFIGQSINMAETSAGLAHWFSGIRVESEGKEPATLTIRNKQEAYNALNKFNAFCSPYDKASRITLVFIGL